MHAQSMTAPATATEAAKRPRLPLYLHIAAWAVPVLVLGQFAGSRA